MTPLLSIWWLSLFSSSACQILTFWKKKKVLFWSHICICMVKFDLFDVLLTRPLLSRSSSQCEAPQNQTQVLASALIKGVVGKLTWPSMLWWWGRVDQQQDTHQGIKTCGLCTKDPQPGLALRNLLAQPLSHKCHPRWHHIASNSDVQGIPIGKSV